MYIKELMDICGIVAHARAVEYAAQWLYHHGATAVDIRMNNVKGSQFYELVADYMDYMQDVNE